MGFAFYSFYYSPNILTSASPSRQMTLRKIFRPFPKNVICPAIPTNTANPTNTGYLTYAMKI